LSLKRERNKIWEGLEQRLEEMRDHLKREALKKKENQYDYKQKEKELTDHLETMTILAQDVDNKNRTLT
jgi:hypothetical protein